MSVKRVVIAGHVDHGKSTLAGRLLADSGALSDAARMKLEAASRRRGTAIDYAYLTDHFQVERDQGMTIDAAEIRFHSAAQTYILVDAPGHKEFLHHMMTGASGADIALLMIDAQDGLCAQTYRHAYLLKMLGLQHVIVLINKMDRVDYAQAAFARLGAQIDACCAAIGLAVRHVIPISAREGENIHDGSAQMRWYTGPHVMQALDGIVLARATSDQPLRLMVQGTYAHHDKTVILGKVEAGAVRLHDALSFYPGHDTARVLSFETWPAADVCYVEAGGLVAMTLDAPVKAARGTIAGHADRPPVFTHTAHVHVFWLSQETLAVGKQYVMRQGAMETLVSVVHVDRVINPQDVSDTIWGGEAARYTAAHVTLRAQEPLAFDADQESRVILYEQGRMAGCGLARAQNLLPATQAARVFWLTGLSGAGKTTLATRVHALLSARGMRTTILDGDVLRAGLCRDLGFSPEDRRENIRRASAVAAMMSEAGLIVIAAFISPYRADREDARRVNEGRFHEIYIKADVATCAARDPKGLYKKARAGTLTGFTGIDAPYEAPQAPDLVIDTAMHTIEDCVAQLADYILARTGHPSSKENHLVATE